MDNAERELRIKLEQLLYGVWNDEEFIDGVFAYMDTAEDVQTVIDYIERGIDVDATQVSLLCLDIGNAKEAANGQG